MKSIRFFNNINKSDVILTGGKGASLGEMFNFGIPVPDGFVILSTTFEEFIFSQKLGKEISLILDKVNVKNQKTITLASKKIQALILSKSISKDLNKEILYSFKKLNSSFVAVRSSATSEDSKDDAWAGQLNTYLNTTSNNLILNIMKCWASLFTERAIFYRFEKKLEKKKISVAVVVQKMVESEKSGIAFSVHPVTEDYNQLIIEAGYGLGEAIVSGQVTPNSYIVSKMPHKILDKNISEQSRELVKSDKGVSWKNIEKKKANSQVLTDKEILSLSTLIQRIENHYGFPVDVEWAIEKNKIYITQSRPITTLKGNAQTNLTLLFSREPDEFTLFRLSAGFDSMTIAFPTIVNEKMNNTCFVFNNQSLVGAYYDMREIQSISQKIVELSIRDPEDIKERIITNIKQFDNLYNKFKDSKNKIKTLYELKSIQKLCADNWMYMQLLTVLPTLPVCEKLKEMAFKMRVKSQEYNLVIQKAITSFLETKYAYLKNKSNFVLPSEVWSKDINNKDLMLERISKREKGYVYFKGNIYTGSIESILNELNIVLQKEETNTSKVDNKIELHKEHSREYSLSRMYAWYRGFSYYFTKIDLIKTDLKHTIFIYTGKNLVDVYYDNKELLDVFKIIEKSANNSFRSVKNCISEFFDLLNKLKPYFNKTKKINTVNEYKKVLEYYASYWAKIAVVFVLPESNFKVSEKIKKLTLDARTKTQEYNEELEPVISEFIERKYKYLKGNSRFVLPDDIFNGDINNKKEMLDRIDERKKGFVYYQGKLYTGNVNNNLDKLNLFLEKQETSVQEIKGQIGYKGKVTGIVRIITSKNQIPDFKNGEIMVSAMTMPNYLPAMKKASAFVTDEGGITSHAAIVARELKKPCVIGTKIATEVLKNGYLVEVDANKGIVRILRK